MKKRNWLISILSVVMVFSLIVGCSSGNGGNKGAAPSNTGGEQQQEGNTPPEESNLYELGKEPLEISIFGNYEWYTMPKWGADPMTQWVQDNKKITIKEIPNGGNNA